jgi:hypothetical protein
MIKWTACIEKYGRNGEKTGWQYIFIDKERAAQLLSGQKKSFRVKGRLDDVPIAQMALIPIGGGDFILPIKNELRRLLKKQHGANLLVSIAYDESIVAIDADLLACLADAPVAKAVFEKLPGAHQRYYTRWINAAKTEATRTKRIAQAIEGLSKQLDFGSMTKMNAS